MSNENQHQHAEYRQPPLNAQGKAFDPDATPDERTFALMMHLTLLGHVLLWGIAIAAPLIMWSIKKDESPFLDDHGREALNFQISLIIYTIFIFPLGLLTCGIGFIVFPILLYVLGLIGMIQAAIAANRGEFYRYPMTIRFIH